jgi:hypothetical protein
VVTDKPTPAALPDLTSPDLLSHDQIEKLLPHLENIIGWAKGVQDLALRQAIQGTKFEGYKVVAGRSNRKISNEELATDILIGEGYKDEKIFQPQTLKSLTQLEKDLGKKVLDKLIGNLIIKPAGKPALVPDTDERPPYDPNLAAADDFSDNVED